MTVNKFKNTPLPKLILSMSVPAILSMFISAMYNIVDSIFVAQLGDHALTAVSLAFPIQSLILAVSVGTGIGLSTLMSRKIGEQNHEYVFELTRYPVTLGLIIGAIFAVLGIFITKPFFAMFTNDALIIKEGCTYTYIVTILSFGFATQICIEKALQSTGNMIMPMLMALTGAIINIILDPILIFGLLGFPALGVAGAAIATVIGQLSGMGIALFFYFKGRHDLKVGAPTIRIRLSVLKDIMKVGFPAMLMQALASLQVLVLNALVSIYSVVAVAVLGICFKLQQFVYMPAFGITQGVRPIMAYFYGAQNKKMLDKTFRLSTIFVSILMGLGTLLFLLFGKYILLAFNPTQEMHNMGIQALNLIALSFIFAGVNIMYATKFQSIGNGNASFFVSLFREALITLPVAVASARIIGLPGVWGAFLIAEIVTLLIVRTIIVRKIKM